MRLVHKQAAILRRLAYVDGEPTLAKLEASVDDLLELRRRGLVALDWSLTDAGRAALEAEDA